MVGSQQITVQVIRMLLLVVFMAIRPSGGAPNQLISFGLFNQHELTSVQLCSDRGVFSNGFTLEARGLDIYTRKFSPQVVQIASLQANQESVPLCLQSWGWWWSELTEPPVLHRPPTIRLALLVDGSINTSIYIYIYMYIAVRLYIKQSKNIYIYIYICIEE